MPEMVEAKVEKKRGRPKFHHMRLRKADGGGVVADHHHMNEDGYVDEKPHKTHVFGKDEGDKLLAHVAKHMGIPGAAEEEGEPEHKHMAHEAEVED